MNAMKRIAALGASVLLLPGLAACGQAAEEITEKTIEDQTGSDVEIEDDGVTVTGEDGNEWSAGENVELPDEWPSAVPVPTDGKLTLTSVDPAAGSASGTWTMTGSAADVIAGYEAQVLQAGFTSTGEFNAEGGSTRMYSGNGLDLYVVAAGEGGETVLSVAANPSA